MFINRDNVCFGKVGQGGGSQTHLCMKPNAGTNRCKISLHKTSKPVDTEALMLGFYIGMPSNVTALMMSKLVPEIWFNNTEVVDKWNLDASFEMIKATAAIWQSVVNNSPSNIARLIHKSELKVDTEMTGDLDDEATVDPARMSHTDLLQSHF